LKALHDEPISHSVVTKKKWPGPDANGKEQSNVDPPETDVTQWVIGWFHLEQIH